MSYSYDYLSRLITSTFHNYSGTGVISGTNNYNENLTYDLRGNIQTLQRTGFYTNGSTCTYGQIDNLTYSYTPNTNRLHKVLDGTVTAGDAKSRGFNGLLSTVDNSMTYDRNGNLNKNLHKNVSTITYNHLNLPTVITFTTGNTIEFLYDAAGTKLRKTVKVGATVQYVQDYLPGGIEYRQTGTGVKRVESVFHAEGRYYNTNVDASNTLALRKEYNFKDHLGNTRLVFTDRNANGVVDITGTASTSDVLQENHYYAFGLAFEGAWLQNDAGARDNAYQYNGKELNSDFGLGWNDYGARWYDPGIGRWNAVDPLADKMPYVSSFIYAFNNPTRLIDPDGRAPQPPNYQRMILYGGARKDSDNSTFLHASRNIAKDYTDVTASVSQFNTGDDIVNSINSKNSNTIQSLDIVSHGGTHALYAGDPDYIEPFHNVSLYDSNPRQIAQLAWGNGADINEINYDKFTYSAKIELHGCKTCSNAGEAGTGSKSDNIASALSSKLYGAGKKQSVVIGHKDSASPMINGDGTSAKQQDYRWGTRVVYHNGSVLFETNQKGRISAAQINQHLKEKLGNDFKKP